MQVKELRGILNHVNPTILAQTRELLDADRRQPICNAAGAFGICGTAGVSRRV